ncbi:PaaI family thioesterase [Desulfovibrio ferrophilus]|uniref:Thioesterase superfamily protein n=1 Tax=Desulfovibrio ferrophilus TaxID=241368 RepID=A0A2Z6AY52_9BACT|nr:PaaI family thioesterase [Desulfovibrio ferrophilus]BBD08110.1 thioesterase superfamily protein [Desulfovibrio ferrophilus]
MPEKYLEAVVHADQAVNPLLTTLGIEVLSAGEGQAVLRLPYDRKLLQGAGVVGGGVLATLADEAMAHAVLSTLNNGRVTATVDMSVRYLSPAGAGEDLRAEAVVIRRGSRVIFTRAEIVDSQGLAVASADASFLVSAKKDKA